MKKKIFIISPNNASPDYRIAKSIENLKKFGQIFLFRIINPKLPVYRYDCNEINLTNISSKYDKKKYTMIVENLKKFISKNNP